ncbi:MAG: hypothetical protein QM650_17980 [Microlunatus sp.]
MTRAVVDDEIGVLVVTRQVTVVELVIVHEPRAAPVPITQGTAVPLAPTNAAPPCATTVTLAVLVTMQVPAPHSSVGVNLPVPDTTSSGTVEIFHPTSPDAAYAGVVRRTCTAPVSSTPIRSKSTLRRQGRVRPEFGQEWNGRLGNALTLSRLHLSVNSTSLSRFEEVSGTAIVKSFGRPQKIAIVDAARNSRSKRTRPLCK